MKNFDWTSFTKRIAIKSSLPEIYEAWTVAANLEKWFLERVVFQVNDNLIEHTEPAKEGITYNWYWYLEATPMNGEILSANGKDFFQFTFEGSSLVDVKLSTLDEYVIVELRHYNIPQDDNSKQHIRLGCSNGWAFYLHNLKSVYEGGIDLRNKDPKLGVMINN
ncbi:SRPBCC domain-containing protein [Chitinophaga silvatica]|uniref:SRPBCC domain-containing protein n=1 Tax=Chitinophaga silvatica TaxID=2282649 RepID=A0A3E1YAP3_9BACT|nr:SRPBCC domain-containing protein [Chitinophaga silvatica]RFS22783.1 SRPBCC domain-containing protein [Chitinophaga silvatica]